MIYPEVKAVNNKYLITFLHGLGADGDDLIHLTSYMKSDLPNCCFFAPHGIEPFDMAPYGRQWFSFSNKDPEVIYQLIHNNASVLHGIILDKQNELKLSNKETVLIGFSQGVMIGSYLSFIQEIPFASLVGFSGKLITPNHCNNKDTPMCIIHGDCDDVLDVKESDLAEKYFIKHNIKHEVHRIPNLGHSIDAKGLKIAVSFIKDSLLIK